jgi:hypothetical protein
MLGMNNLSIGFVILIVIILTLIVSRDARDYVFGPKHKFIIFEYKAYPNSQFIIGSHSNLAGNIEALTALSNETELCVAFATNGTLHRRISIPNMMPTIEPTNESWKSVHTYVKYAYVKSMVSFDELTILINNTQKFKDARALR